MYGRPKLLDREVERTLETHVSWLMFTAGSVYKLKKPVDLGFLDFSTPARRKAACEAEVRLNRPLGADVYRGVLDVRREGDWVRILGPCPGAACSDAAVDHVVEMRRLPQARAFSRLVPEGRVGPRLLTTLAHRIAAFHAAAARGPEVDRYGTPEAIGALVTENLEGLAPFAGAAFSRRLYVAFEAAQRGFLETRRDWLEARVAAGRIRDVHGDLHLEHVFLLDGEGDPAALRIIDCIEFSPRYRCGDVAGDVAFLSMSFGLHGRPDLGEALFSFWAAELLDYDAFRVVDFYRLYRALVRLKVTCLSNDPAHIRQHVERVEAEVYPDRPAPFVLGVGGTVASGKTTVAALVAARTGAELLSTDGMRKAVLGVPPERTTRAPFGQGAYTPEAKRLVYAALIDAARAIAEGGRPVVVDATLSRPEQRAALKGAAKAAGAPFLLVSLTADEAVLRARLEAREREPAGASDARLEHLPGMLAAYAAPDEIPTTQRIDLDTGRVTPEQAAALIAEALPVSVPAASPPSGREAPAARPPLRSRRRPPPPGPPRAR